MVEKFDDKDVKNGNFNSQMDFRKKSNIQILKINPKYNLGD
jgi:hypothetical protein